MWDLKTIVKINEIASELAKEGKNPSAAIHELSKRRSQARKEYEEEQAKKTDDNQEEGVTTDKE